MTTSGTDDTLPAPETIPVVAIEQVRAFAAASGDSNPIHISPDAARAAGFDAPLLHGMFIAGRFETFLERFGSYHIAELRVNFVRPVPVGSALTISSRRIAGPDLRLRLLANIAGGALVAVAEARLAATSEPAQ